MRVALVHDWLTGMRGGERCLAALVRMFPDTTIHTLVHRPGRVAPVIEDRPIHTSFIDRLPFAHTHYRYYLPLFPRAVERLELGDVDLVLSTSHCVAKGVTVPAGARHLCYCFTPMRYVWDMHAAYLGRHKTRLPIGALARVVAAPLRRWDARTAARVDRFLACSHHIRRKIERYFRRRARVTYPPVDVERFRADRAREDFYLVVSALVPYKRIDLAIAAFNRVGRRLVIVGEGTEYRRLTRLAGPTVSFTGRIGDQEVADLLARCRGFVFPGEEDFGIAAVEAQASGAPVIAYGRGGVTEIVRGPDQAAPDAAREATGVFFHEQTPDALVEAVRRADQMTFDPSVLRENAMRFHPRHFERGIREAVDRLVGEGSDESVRPARQIASKRFGREPGRT